MEKLTEVLPSFWDMGGYAAYVWPAYATALLIIAFMAMASLRENRRARLELSRLQAPASE